MPNISNWFSSNISEKEENDFLESEDYDHNLADILINELLIEEEGFCDANLKNIYYLFYNCSSLLSLPDISKWNAENFGIITGLFYGCSSLKLLPDISKWNTVNINLMNGLFCDCSSLLSILIYQNVKQKMSLI